MSVSRVIMVASSAFLTLAGLGCLFLPELVAEALREPAGGAILVQLAAAGMLAIALVNWVVRRHVMGGIYGRPVVVGNFVNAGILTLVLGSAQLSESSPAGLVVTVLCLIYWAAFIWLLFRGGQPRGRWPLADGGGQRGDLAR